MASPCSSSSGSGKGTCGRHDICTCYPGYRALDCSERVCHFGRAWGDAPNGNDRAHDYTECSSRGICDRKTADCNCYDGFTGDACHYTMCPNDCNGHGTCEFIGEIATDSTVQYGSVSDRQYNEWDARKNRLCKCDAYWTGNDCSKRMCPKGNDPLTKMIVDTMGGTTMEVEEVQTIAIHPQLHTDNHGYYAAIAGDFTLSYTDAYNQEWTTRPIRVATQISNTQVGGSTFVGDITIVDAATGSTITDKARRFNLFEPYDSVRVTAAAYSYVTTITKIECIFAMTDAGGASDKPCVVETLPRIPARAAAAESLVIQLVSLDTGEIGVKRMLQELPNQVIPSITVDETLTKNSNTYKVTFSDMANSGDQHMLTCKVASCDTDGCQPRKKAIKGWYRVALSAHASSPGTSTSLVVAAGGVGGAFTHFRSGVYISGGITAGMAQFQRFDTTVEDRTIVVSSVSTTTTIDDTLNLDAAYVTALGNSDTFTVSQIHDFTDDSIGELTGGDGNGASAVSGRSANVQSVLDCAWTTNAAGLNGLTSVSNAFSPTTIVVGDMISIKCSTATNDGYYKVSRVALDGSAYNVEGPVTAVAASIACVIKKITPSPCTVTETQKGTSELALCSRHGNCDVQTGFCACFPGYFGEACSLQTVLV